MVQSPDDYEGVGGSNEWTVRVADTTGMGALTLQQLEESARPSIAVLSPTTDVSTAIVAIGWTDDDPDSDAQISLFYDTDRIGANGVLIASGIGEDDPSDTYSWDTAGVPTGDYYIYAVIDDGMNEPAISYATGRVSVLENHCARPTYRS